jgi:hypothetical protein
MYKILLSGDLKKSYQIDPKDSWLLAAAEKNLPMFVPGWEDSTLGNMYAGHCISQDVKKIHTVRTGIEYMMELAEWYTKTTEKTPLGFLRVVLRGRAQRKDHLGQARRDNAQVHHRVGCIDCGAADFCLRSGVVERVLAVWQRPIDT